MAGFTTKTFTVYDTYITPRYAWENVTEYVPKKIVEDGVERDIIIWELFYGDGESKKIWNRMGYKNVIHKPYPKYDAFKWEPEKYDIIISNPPFSKSKEVLERLKELGKPYLMIMPASKLNTQYYRKYQEGLNEHLQWIVPRSRIQFQKLENGRIPKNNKNCCNFDCYYYCFKMNLPKTMLWLGDEKLKRNKPEWTEQHKMGIDAKQQKREMLGMMNEDKYKFAKIKNKYVRLKNIKKKIVKEFPEAECSTCDSKISSHSMSQSIACGPIFTKDELLKIPKKKIKKKKPIKINEVKFECPNCTLEPDKHTFQQGLTCGLMVPTTNGGIKFLETGMVVNPNGFVE